MKEIIKMIAEINEIENRKAVEKIKTNKTKSCFFMMSNKINISLAWLTKKEKTKMTKNQKGKKCYNNRPGRHYYKDNKGILEIIPHI